MDRNTPNEIMSIMAAYERGEPIEYKGLLSDLSSGWSVANGDRGWDFQHYRYRVAEDVESRDVEWRDQAVKLAKLAIDAVDGLGKVIDEARQLHGKLASRLDRLDP